MLVGGWSRTAIGQTHSLRSNSVMFDVRVSSSWIGRTRRTLITGTGTFAERDGLGVTIRTKHKQT